jgi:hypothetical protein
MSSYNKIAFAASMFLVVVEHDVKEIRDCCHLRQAGKIGEVRLGGEPLYPKTECATTIER